MKKVKIIADSVSDMTLEEAKKYDIDIVPLTIIFDNKEYRDGVDIDTNGLFRLMEEKDGFPQTAQVSPGVFYEKFKEYRDQDREIVLITMSSKLSGTFNSANMAKNQLGQEGIYIVDSLNVTMGQYCLVKYAISLRDQGKSAQEIFTILEEAKNKVKSSVYLDTLDNLARSGRISRATEFVGSMLKIKPIIRLIEGQIIPVSRERGQKKAIQYVVNDLKKEGLRPGTKVILGSCLETDNLGILEEVCQEMGFPYECLEVGAVTASHIGPNAMGYFLIEE